MEWESQDELIASIPERCIPTYEHLCYDEFLAKHLVPNTPFLLSATATASWPARQLWVAPGDTSRPNLTAIYKYADQVVPVANTRLPQWGEFERSERPLQEVLHLWAEGEGEGLYVKDWHLLAEIVEGGGWEGEVYKVPDCFRDDWLNPPFRTTPPIDSSPTQKSAVATSDFRFTYLGPPGTFTPLHRDVYASYSWSANVVGRKVWWLFPPDRLEIVQRDGELVFDVRSLPDEGRGIKILQQPGEVIFVPSGWHHQVVNVDFCISINHNFFSSITLPRIFDALETSQGRVEESIADVKEMIRERLGDAVVAEGVELCRKEWAEEVQGLLERDAGWGWKGFWGTIQRNIEQPSAPPSLRPDDRTRDENIQAVIQRYGSKEEYRILGDVREVVHEIQQSLDARMSTEAA